jgi:Peptidase family M23
MGTETFSSSVLQHVDKAYQIIYRSLENRNDSLEILFRAAADFRQIHTRNKQRTNHQYSFHKRALKKNSFTERKNAAIRRYHPTGADAFQALVKEYVEIEELKQERKEIVPTLRVSYFRYLKKIFDNNCFEKGAFGPITGLYGLLFANPAYFIVELSSVFHGISTMRDKKARNYRDEDYFVREIESKSIDLYRRFSPLEIFEETDVKNLNNELVKSLQGITKQWFKIEPLDKEGDSLIEETLKLLSPWGEEPALVKDPLNRNFRVNEIPDFVFGGKNPIKEIPVVRKRIASVMHLNFSRTLIDNEYIGANDMSKDLHLPVPKPDKPNTDLTWKFVEQLDADIKLKIADEALQHQQLRSKLEEFDISIEVDGEEKIVLASNQARYEPIAVPEDARVICIRAKVTGDGGVSKSIPLATLLIKMTDLMEGEEWLSEAVLENKFHLSLQLKPSVINIDGKRFSHYLLNVDYHSSEECPLIKPRFRGLISFLERLSPASRKINADAVPVFSFGFSKKYLLLSACIVLFLIYEINLFLSIYQEGSVDFLNSIYIPLGLIILSIFLLGSILKSEIYSDILSFDFKVSSKLLVACIITSIFSVTTAFQVLFISPSMMQPDIEAGLNMEFTFDTEEEEKQTELELKRIETTSNPEFLPTMWAHLGKIINEFGFRRNPFAEKSFEFHPGMDIDGERGDDVVAPANGIVVKAGWEGGYGNMIEIDHGNGLTTRYGHLSKIEVSVGELVQRRQLIGLVGSTGRTTLTHLHYELRLNDKAINPRRFLPPEPLELYELINK